MRMRLVNLHGESAQTTLYCKECMKYSMSLSQVYCICVNLILMSQAEQKFQHLVSNIIESKRWVTDTAYRNNIPKNNKEYGSKINTIFTDSLKKGGFYNRRETQLFSYLGISYICIATHSSKIWIQYSYMGAKGKIRIKHGLYPTTFIDF